AVAARVGVDAGLEALAVDVVGDRLHAAGPLGLVDGDVAGRVAGALPPALVDVDVPVPGGRQPGGDHRVGLPLDHVRVDVGGEAVPGRPAHRRRGYRHLVAGDGDRQQGLWRPIK